MFVISQAFLWRHGVVFQFLTCFFQAGSFGIRTYHSAFQVAHPFLQRRNGCLVELIDADKNIFRENIGRHTCHNRILFLDVDLQLVAGVYTDKVILSVIQIVTADAYVEVQNADGVDLLYMIVCLAQRDMLGDGFGHSVKNAFQIVKFARVLYLDDDDFVFTVARFDVYAVEFIVSSQLVTFAFEYFHDSHFFPQEYGEETFENTKVCLLA